MVICSLLFWKAGVQADLLFRNLSRLPQVNTEGAIKEGRGGRENASADAFSQSLSDRLYDREEDLESETDLKSRGGKRNLRLSVMTQ